MTSLVVDCIPRLPSDHGAFTQEVVIQDGNSLGAAALFIESAKFNPEWKGKRCTIKYKEHRKNYYLITSVEVVG